jgi:hypothetical protein
VLQLLLTCVAGVRVTLLPHRLVNRFELFQGSEHRTPRAASGFPVVLSRAHVFLGDKSWCVRFPMFPAIFQPADSRHLQRPSRIVEGNIASHDLVKQRKSMSLQPHLFCRLLMLLMQVCNRLFQPHAFAPAA